MKVIYFAVNQEGQTMAATSLSNIAPFVGYSADRLRRLMKGRDKLELKTGTIYRTVLYTIEGRGNLQNFMY
jgi:hypothetical protein